MNYIDEIQRRINEHKKRNNTPTAIYIGHEVHTQLRKDLRIESFEPSEEKICGLPFFIVAKDKYHLAVV